MTNPYKTIQVKALRLFFLWSNLFLTSDQILSGHPESACRSAHQPNPTRCLIETAYAVLDETDVVEDYKIQVLAEDPIAFAASKSDLDTSHYNKAMETVDSAQ
jgi:hypothetical protein